MSSRRTAVRQASRQAVPQVRVPLPWRTLDAAPCAEPGTAAATTASCLGLGSLASAASAAKRRRIGGRTTLRRHHLQPRPEHRDRRCGSAERSEHAVPACQAKWYAWFVRASPAEWHGNGSLHCAGRRPAGAVRRLRHGSARRHRIGDRYSERDVDEPRSRRVEQHRDGLRADSAVALLRRGRAAGCSVAPFRLLQERHSVCRSSSRTHGFTPVRASGWTWSSVRSSPRPQLRQRLPSRW
jgi:hypothetical protein